MVNSLKYVDDSICGVEMSKDFVSIEKQLKKFYLLTNDFNKNVFILHKMHIG